MAVQVKTLNKVVSQAVGVAQEVPARAKFRMMPTLWFAAGFAASWIPGIGGAASHFFDRLKSGNERKYELNFRAKQLKTQIAQTLGVSEKNVNGNDLLAAAAVNPALRRNVEEVLNKEKAENRSSMMINTGVTAAGMIGMGGAAKLAAEATTGAKMLHHSVQAAKVMGGALTGGAVAGLFNKADITSHELLEAADKDLQRARNEGLPGQAAINPMMIFMVRVAQDAALHKEINTLSKQQFGKVFHQLDAQQMETVMNRYPQLADATLNEAKAIVSGAMPVWDLAATAPNMGGQAGAMARADQPVGGFAAREMARRTNNNVANDNPAVANGNGGGFAARIDAERAAARANGVA